MASALIKEISDDFLICQICLETFRHPKTLECLHSFCEECLQAYHKTGTGKLSCPTCRRDTALPNDNIRELRTSFFLIDLVDTIGARKKVVNKSAEKILCDSCSSGARAKSRCFNCNDFLCQQCVQIHKDLKAFRGHVVASFADLQSGKFDLNPEEFPRNEPTCDKHTGEKMRFYCTTCEEAICHNCTVLDHQKPEHEIRDIHGVADEQRETIKDFQTTTEKKLAELEKMSKSLESDLKYLVKRRDIRRQELKLKVSSLTSAIEKLRKQCEEEIQKQYVLNEKTSVAKRHEVELAKGRLESTREFVKNILSHGSDAEISATFRQVEDSVEELTSTSLLSFLVDQDEGSTLARTDSGNSTAFQLLSEIEGLILEEQRAKQNQAWGENVETYGAHAQSVTSPRGVGSRPVNQSRILLKGVPKQVTEDAVYTHLKSLGISDVKPCFVYGSRQGTVMVECPDVISDIDGKLKAVHRTKLSGSKVTAEKVLVCDCVEVHNLPRHANSQSLFTYFNKQRRSGGGGVAEVKVDEERRAALVSFQNYKVAERVLERRHVIGKSELAVKPFYSCLGQTAPKT